VAVGFQWDETLYAGSAPYYCSGRVPYPAELGEVIAAEMSLDGSGRLLDVGCGPGSLTLLLAPRFAGTVGIDADPGMVAQAQAQAQAQRAGCTRVTWHQMRAEELPGGLGRFRLITFAQSFHWVDQPQVASVARGMLDPDGALVIIYATTHQGAAGDDPLPSPRPPRQEIAELVASYLGPLRRAGRGFIPDGGPGIEDGTFLAAGFNGRTRVKVGGGLVTRSEDEVVASVFSLSSAAPHQFGDRLGEFETDLRGLLRSVSPEGQFSERMREAAVDIWRP
jgi:SAM-dependent methyltransferase